MNGFRQKLLIAIGAALGGAALLVLATALVKSDIGKRAERIVGARNATASQTKAIELLTTLKDQSSRSLAYASFLENILPERDQLIRFPADLESIGRSHRVDFKAKFGNEEKGDALRPGAVSFQASAQGAFDDFIAFLASLKKSRYFIDFQSFTLGGGSSGKFSITMNGRVFFRE